MRIGEKARDRILSLCSPKNILQQRLNHIQHLLDHPKPHHLFPSLNYPPHGHINLPSVTSFTENNPLLSVSMERD
ncbi:hypothetical protein PN462_03385 [Spirulina sp. CS-785/01]|uniref:hypothetical protein n=1 Tax=Spirulina sp. CS-785/01 TaxID=3021716 RepID=UPI00232AAA63|nr:hypothetical protein [Spirulina sp. CS-785/01]MDB9312132.1 hypothetical protein [Spirulina sp. CS-785/01]